MDMEIELYKNRISLGTRAIWDSTEKLESTFGGDIYSPAVMLDVFRSNYSEPLGVLIDSGHYI
jgi:hypothetical protein